MVDRPIFVDGFVSIFSSNAPKPVRTFCFVGKLHTQPKSRFVFFLFLFGSIRLMFTDESKWWRAKKGNAYYLRDEKISNSRLSHIAATLVCIGYVCASTVKSNQMHGNFYWKIFISNSALIIIDFFVSNDKKKKKKTSKMEFSAVIVSIDPQYKKN